MSFLEGIAAILVWLAGFALGWWVFWRVIRAMESRKCK